jgi:hypothetical protein
MNTIKAIKLRNMSELGIVPDDKPGWYQWWASDAALKILLRDQFSELYPLLTPGSGSLNGFRYIYVGVAIKESIRARLNWHVNQVHTFSGIKHGTLSTLRQSISSLAGNSQGDEAATNDVIDMLMVAYFPVDLPIRSPEAKTSIGDVEREEMGDHILPLNIQHNHQSVLLTFKNSLRVARKAAKQRYLQNL